MAKQETQAITVTLIEGTKAIDKAITSIATRGKKLDGDIHTAACSTLNHAIMHGDVTLAQKLVAALPKSGRAKALAAWMVAFGPFALEKGALVYLKGSHDLEGAIAKPFWDFLPEANPVQFDLTASLKSLLAKAEKALESETQDLSKISPAMLAELRKLVEVPAETTAE